jgi:hypothetical protein
MSYRGTSRASKQYSLKELLIHHQKHHPNEIKLGLSWRYDGTGTAELGCEFAGRWIKFRELNNPPKYFIGHELGMVEYRPISEVAFKLLESVFGKDKDKFVCAWSFPTGVVWNEYNDYITAFAPDGFTASIKGSNIVEAAIWLPEMHQEYLNRKSEVPKGIRSVHITIHDGEEYSIAASPVHLWCRVPIIDYNDPANINLDYVRLEVKNTFERSLRNRK